MSANECINRREFLKGMTVSSMGLTIGAQALTAITLTSSEPAIAGDAADERGKDAANGYRLLHNVQYGVVDNTPLLMNITIPDPKPKKPVPAILFLHGGGWGGGSREDMMSHCYFVSKAGYVGASVEYRLVNQAPFPAQLQDCKGAVRFIRANAKKYGINPDLIGVWGCSAGGHLAAMIGLTEGIAEFEGDCGNPGVSSQVQLVVDGFGPTDLERWQEIVNKWADDKEAYKLFAPPVWDASMAQPPIWGEAMFQWWKNFSLSTDPNMSKFFTGGSINIPKEAKWASPVTYADRKEKAPPFLFVHGTLDTWVPLQQSIQLANALDKNGVKVDFLLEINVDHDDSKAFPKILEYLRKTLPLSDAS